jgi:two-component system sensor histidine kinase UhpB
MRALRERRPMTLPLPSDAAALSRELRIHQIELETQNEELRRAQRELAASRDRFQNLFEVAPVGYLSLDATGRIAEVNPTGARLLDRHRAQLLGQLFATCLHVRDRRRWRDHIAALAADGASGRLEASLAAGEPTPRAVQLDTLRLPQPGPDAALRVVLTDISERRAAENDRRVTALLLDAREAERLRVARTLHEDLGQRLSAAKMALSLLPLEGPASAAANDRAGALQRDLDEAIALVRRMANELRPSMIDDLGLNAALQWLARDASPRFGLDVDLQPMKLNRDLDARTVIGVYRLMEGLLAAIARDTSGARVGIDVRQERQTLCLDLVVHPGGWPLGPLAPARTRPARGSPSAVPMTLQAELRHLGGQLLVLPAPQGAASGTGRLRLEVPLRAPRPQQVAPGGRARRRPAAVPDRR